MNKDLSDLIFIGFAQLSYLDWHKLKKGNGKKLKMIFGEGSDDFNQIKTKKYKDYKKTNYAIDVTSDGKRIYSSEDSRLFYLYSEDSVNAEANPKYPEFGNWEFIT